MQPVRWRRFNLLLVIVLACAAPLRARAPELSLRDLDGKTHSLADYQGKIVVLNFWATWCVPCADEMPMLVKVHHEYAARSVVVVGVSLDDEKTRANIPEFLRKKKISFPIWVGGTTDDLKRLGLGQALPATAFLDAEGHVVGRVLGELRKKDLGHRIEWMLGKHEGPPPEPLENHLGRH